MNYGLLESVKEFTAYVLGNNAMPWVQFKPDGNWEPDLPQYENQTTKLTKEETSACTVHGSLNQIETMWKFRYKGEPNYSERFTYLNVPIDPRYGTDPQNTYETIRKHGVVDEKYLPMTDTLAEYLDSSDITGSMRAKGQDWLRKTTYQHEWLWFTPPQNYREVLKEALKTCPIAVSVYAWAEQNGEYVSLGNVNNHWVLLYRVDDDGSMWIFDSYDHSKKKLSKDHFIKRAKRIWLQRKTTREMRKDIRTLTGVIEYLKTLLMEQKDLLYYANQYITSEYDPTPNDEYPDEVSCAWSLSTLENKANPKFKRIPGTWTLWDYYEHNPDFTRVTVPSPGTRIICPTTQGHPFPGHCGVFMEDMTIASNDSRTGKFIKNYTFETWYERYVTKGGYQIYLYNHV